MRIIIAGAIVYGIMHVLGSPPWMYKVAAVVGLVILLVIVIAVVIALEQLGLATPVVLTAFAIAFGALMLGLAIAFGLGGRDAARQLLEQHFTAQERREIDATPHL